MFGLIAAATSPGGQVRADIGAADRVVVARALGDQRARSQSSLSGFRTGRTQAGASRRSLPVPAVQTVHDRSVDVKPKARRICVKGLGDDAEATYMRIIFPL